MTLSPRAIEAAANEIRKVRLLLVGGSGASIPSDHLYAEAAITAYLDALAVDGLCLVEQRSERSTELKIGDRVRVSMRRRRLMYETEPFWRGQIIGETREGHAWIVRRDLYKTPAAYHKNFCSKEIAAASTGDSPRQTEG